jgi:alkaline phosphatase D
MITGHRDRRTFLSTTLKAAGGFALAPSFLRQDAARPGMPYGVSSGDVGRDRAIIWSAADRPARMLVEWATTESFQNARRVRGPATDMTAGFTARVDLSGVPGGQHIFYRVQFEDLKDSRNVSAPVAGSFLSPPAAPRDVAIAWSADTVGQGWGINEAFGGLRMYETIRRASPDLFVHCGDTIYADSPVPQEIRLDDGTTWRNVTTPQKSKVAETLDEFRGNYGYNFLDGHLRRFNAEIPQLMLWDDHEVKNNWFPGMSLEADKRYTEKDARVLAANARRAFLEHSPIRLAPGPPPPIYRSCAYGPLVDVFALDLRTYRSPNSANRQPAPGTDTVHAGAQQMLWLKRALQSSRAVWKVIASDLPIGLVVRDGAAAYEAIANADAGPPLGRELEIADLLRFMRRERIRNVVWITADVHYAAAHHYDPARARIDGFDPFWEFVAGPLHAGTFGPGELDGTFGPEVRFCGVPPGMRPNRPPSEGLQFFGMVRVSGRSRVMTVELRNLAGERLYAVELEPV